MKKKIFIIICIVLLAIISIGIVSASMEEVGGIKFNIPEGYSSGGSLSIGTSNSNTDSVNFKNGDSYIGITVEANTAKDSLEKIVNKTSSETGFKNTTIAGITGYSDTTKEGLRFIYLQDDKSVFIIAPDESVIESMIVK